MSLDIVITGVGGQGNVLASRVLARAAMDAGLEVRTSEAIGMAQREGVVISQVRIGGPLWGALIPEGGADVLLGFELAETVRGLSRLKPGGVVVASTAVVVPVTAALGLSAYYIDALRDYLRQNIKNLYLVDAGALAEEAGHPRTVNTVMLGAMAGLSLLPFAREHLLRTVLNAVPEAYRTINERAFDLGRRAVGVH